MVHDAPECSAQAAYPDGAYIGWANADGSVVIGSLVWDGHVRFGLFRDGRFTPLRPCRCACTERVICTYRVRGECEERFLGLLGRHWRTLHELGFVTDEKPLAFRGTEDGLTYVEIFTWVEGGFGQAHEHPDVLAIWEPMEPLLEDRDGRPRWEFPHFEPVSLSA